jgi:hypothetical protein
MRSGIASAANDLLLSPDAHHMNESLYSKRDDNAVTLPTPPTLKLDIQPFKIQEVYKYPFKVAVAFHARARRAVLAVPALEQNTSQLRIRQIRVPQR